MINNGYEIQGYYGKVPPWIGFGKGCVPGAVSGPAVVCFEAIARLALFAGMEARFSTLPSSSWINRLACKDMYWVRETYMVKDLTKLPWSKGISLHFSLPSGEQYKDHTITTTGEKRLYVTMNSCDKPINANYLTLRIQRRTLGCPNYLLWEQRKKPLLLNQSPELHRLLAASRRNAKNISPSEGNHP